MMDREGPYRTSTMGVRGMDGEKKEILVQTVAVQKGGGGSGGSGGSGGGTVYPTGDAEKVSRMGFITRVRLSDRHVLMNSARVTLYHLKVNRLFRHVNRLFSEQRTSHSVSLEGASLSVSYFLIPFSRCLC